MNKIFFDPDRHEWLDEPALHARLAGMTPEERESFMDTEVYRNSIKASVMKRYQELLLEEASRMSASQDALPVVMARAEAANSVFVMAANSGSQVAEAEHREFLRAGDVVFSYAPRNDPLTGDAYLEFRSNREVDVNALDLGGHMFSLERQHDHWVCRELDNAQLTDYLSALGKGGLAAPKFKWI